MRGAPVCEILQVAGIRLGTADDRSGAFAQLVDEHARLMGAAIRRVCQDRQLIPDIEQEVRLALWKKLQGGKNIDHPVSYVYKVALTTAMTVVRRHSRREQPMDVEGLEEVLTPVPALPNGLSEVERGVLLREVLSDLPPDEARALRGYMTGMNHKDIAQMFSWTESVARHRIYRALERLRTRAAESHP